MIEFWKQRDELLAENARLRKQIARLESPKVPRTRDWSAVPLTPRRIIEVLSQLDPNAHLASVVATQSKVKLVPPHSKYISRGTSGTPWKRT